MRTRTIRQPTARSSRHCSALSVKPRMQELGQSDRVEAGATTRLCRLCTRLTTIFDLPKIRIPSKHDMEGAMSGIEMLGTVLTIALIVLLAWNYFYSRT